MCLKLALLWIQALTNPNTKNQLYYDAVQLASAISLRNALIQAQLPDIVFLTADDRLITIAQTIGLPSDNPNNFP